MNLVSKDENVRHSIGTQNSVKWTVLLDGHVVLQYQAGEKILHVALECAEGAPSEFEAVGEESENHYKFRLKHECACWDACAGRRFLFFRKTTY